MGKPTLIGPALPHIPWEERPPGRMDVVWRSQKNPIITRQAVPNANSIFNSAVVPFHDGFVGVFRVDTTERVMQLHVGKSRDGIEWEISSQRIQFVSDEPEVGRFVYGYDPRVVRLGDGYYLTWCNWYYGPTIGLAYTYDFETFYQMENAFYRSTATAFSSPVRSAANTPCSTGPVTLDTLLSVTSSIRGVLI